eukprot:2499762-Rhodomonas_salina.3
MPTPTHSKRRDPKPSCSSLPHSVTAPLLPLPPACLRDLDRAAARAVPLPSNVLPAPLPASHRVGPWQTQSFKQLREPAHFIQGTVSP